MAASNGYWGKRFFAPSWWAAWYWRGKGGGYVHHEDYDRAYRHRDRILREDEELMVILGAWLTCND